jgi:hypothetical protein
MSNSERRCRMEAVGVGSGQWRVSISWGQRFSEGENIVAEDSHMTV